MLSLVSFGTSPIIVLDLLELMGIQTLDDINPLEIKNSTKIYLNGRFIGITDYPIELVNILILLRRNNLNQYVDNFTSISFYKLDREIIINTDNGRFCRPLYILENNQFLIQPKHIDKIKSGDMNWYDLLKNNNITKDDSEFIKKFKT